MVLSHFTFLDTGWWHHTRPHQLATGAMLLTSRLRAPRRARTHAASTLRYPPCTLQLAAATQHCWPPGGSTMRTVDTCIRRRHPLKIGSRQPQIVLILNSANLQSHWPPIMSKLWAVFSCHQAASQPHTSSDTSELISSPSINVWMGPTIEYWISSEV